MSHSGLFSGTILSQPPAKHKRTAGGRALVVCGSRIQPLDAASGFPYASSISRVCARNSSSARARMQGSEL